jgi:hypothetical protein
MPLPFIWYYYCDQNKEDWPVQNKCENKKVKQNFSQKMNKCDHVEDQGIGWLIINIYIKYITECKVVH